MLDILVLNWIYAWDCLLTLVFNQESYCGTSTLNLEESWGDSPEPFIGNSATLLCCILCISLIILVCIISFNSAFVLRLISLSHIHPPLGNLQSILNWFNNYRLLVILMDCSNFISWFVFGVYIVFAYCVLSWSLAGLYLLHLEVEF